MKNKSLLTIAFLVFLLVLTSCKTDETSDPANVTVFSGGMTDYSIVTAEDASDEVKALAEELYDLSGARPEMLSDKSPESPYEILIGGTSRAAASEYVQRLKSESTASAFHFLIAEEDRKIIILSDTDIGYIYALDYIKTAYIRNNDFKVPAGTYDLRQVIWDDYYNSDLYYDRLVAEADKNRFEEGSGKPGNGNDYQEGDNTIMTVGQVIEQYKSMLASFTTADFGEYTADMFTSVNTYRTPTVYPGETHPRVLFTENSIATVRNNLTASENDSMYKKYIALSDVPCDGKFKPVTGTMTNNYDADMMAKIEAKAFRYAMTGEKLYGYEALYAIKNSMLTIDLPHTVGEWARSYGHMLYVLACVYDWCYDLMTEDDKAQLLSGGVNLVGWHLEMVCRVSSTNKAPIGQGTMYGHGAEAQLLVQYLAFAIACYNEAPEIYELCAGRVLNDYVEAQDYLLQSGSHWEGVFYSAWRTESTMIASLLINRMSDGAATPFNSDNLEEAIETMTYYIRPDEQPFRIGDVHANGTSYGHGNLGYVSLYAATLYGNSYLKNIAYKHLNSFNTYTNETPGASAVMFLAINDPQVSYIYEGTAPLTQTTSYPGTNIFAKSANNDKNAFAIYMTMPENYVSSHAHMECGSFQIFYKGILASDSGAYTTWGDAHHMGYTMQTISSNSLLVYNPNLVNTSNSLRPTFVYTGGQSISKDLSLPNKLSDLLKHERLGQCTSLGVANVEKDGKYLYSYMGGDMTAAYDEETVDEVTRYMFAVATGEDDSPLVFMTFDRITSDNASYHKSALIHVQEEPTLTNNGFAIVTNTKHDNSGKMIVQTVGYATEYTVIGGTGKEYWVAGVDENGNYSLENGYNIASNKTYVEDSIAEDGWGRIEISPAEADLTNHMLTVMYVTDAKNSSSPVKAENIASDNLAGAEIFGKAVLFPENEKLLSEESSFTLNAAAECFIVGVDAGTWAVTNGSTIHTAVVEEGVNLINFTANATGSYTLTRID